MATRPDRTQSVRIDTDDGRAVFIRTYDDQSIRVQISGTPYVLSECYLQGEQGHAIVKLVPDRRGEQVTPDKVTTGRKWSRNEFATEADARAFVRQAASEDRQIEGPIAPGRPANAMRSPDGKAGPDVWVVWTA
jgi:hypothetical protein